MPPLPRRGHRKALGSCEERVRGHVPGEIAPIRGHARQSHPRVDGVEAVGCGVLVVARVRTGGYVWQTDIWMLAKHIMNATMNALFEPGSKKMRALNEGIGVGK